MQRRRSGSREEPTAPFGAKPSLSQSSIPAVGGRSWEKSPKQLDPSARETIYPGAEALRRRLIGTSEIAGV